LIFQAFWTDFSKIFASNFDLSPKRAHRKSQAGKKGAGGTRRRRLRYYLYSKGPESAEHTFNTSVPEDNGKKAFGKF
jgi:hypothetical protein